jgi:hypothetical protein
VYAQCHFALEDRVSHDEQRTFWRCSYKSLYLKEILEDLLNLLQEFALIDDG